MTENFSKTTRFTNARSSRFGPLPLPTNLDGTPPGVYKPLPGSDGYRNDVGTPPPGIASDTRRSSPRTPHQCRTLARSQAPRTQSPACSSAKGIAQLHIKGVLPPSFPQENLHTLPAHGIPCEQGNNNASNDENRRVNGWKGGRSYPLFPSFCLSVGVCL